MNGDKMIPDIKPIYDAYNNALDKLKEPIYGINCVSYKKYHKKEHIDDLTQELGVIIKNHEQNIAKYEIEIAKRDAKILAYEKIISNSNFKAVLPNKGTK